MQSFVTSKNAQWRRLIWPTLYKCMYRVRQIKVIPWRFLSTSQQRIGIFTRNLTWLFSIHIYVYNFRIVLNYHNIWLNYAISIEATPRFVTCKFYACVITVAFSLKQQKLRRPSLPAERQWGHSGIN